MKKQINKSNGRPKRFTDSQILKAFQLHEKEGLTYQQLGDKLGCHYQTFNYRFKKLGLTKGYSSARSENDRRFTKNK